MKNKILVSMLIAILTILSAFSFAADVVRVQLDGQYLNFTDENGATVNPQVLNNRTMVPMRKIFEAYGATIEWNEDTRTVTATLGSKQVVLTIDSANATIRNLEDGTEEAKTLDSVPVIFENRTLVPIRFISEGLDKVVGWDSDERVAIIIDFEKLAETYKEKLPAIQKLIDLNLEEMVSYKSESALAASLTYMDLEDESQNETINLDGTVTLNISKTEDMYAGLIAHVSGGNGDIMNAIVDGGLEDLDITGILKDGRFLVGMKDGEGYIWSDRTEDIEGYSSSVIDINALGGNTFDKMISSVDDYQDVVEFVKSYIGDLNVNTYATLVSAADLVASVLDEKALSVKDLEDGTSEFILNLNFMEVLGKIMPLSGINLPDANMSLELRAIINGNRIENETAKIAIDYTSEESLETIAFEINLDTTYSEINESFEIEEPAL